MKKKVIVPDQEWESSIYSKIDWEQSVTVVRYEHDYIQQVRTIEYMEK